MPPVGANGGINPLIRKTCNIDENTGQILSERQYKFNIFDDDKGYLFRAKNHSRRMFEDIRLSDVIKDRNDFMRCHLLAENIYKDTNMIAYRVNSRTVRPADIEDISEIINLSYKKAREFLNRMKKLHILAEREDKVGDTVSTKYYFNPLFFCSKKYLPTDLYFLFQESLDCYLPRWVVAKFHEVGNIKKDCGDPL